jgi:hypothetical protein
MPVEDDNIRPPPHYHPDEGPQIVTADTARQGPAGRRILVLLVVSLVVLCAAWAIVEWFFARGH